MLQMKKIMGKKRPKPIDASGKRNCIGILFIELIIICLGACSPKHSSYSEFQEFEKNEWRKNAGYEFKPQFADSIALYDVNVAFCYTHEYPYRNMSAVIDFIKADSLVLRKHLDCMIIDVNGNWLTPGFGTMYQSEHELLVGVEAKCFDKIVVWHGLNCDTLKNILKVGIILNPIKSE